MLTLGWQALRLLKWTLLRIQFQRRRSGGHCGA